ncbi:MAG: hypothetical protein P8Y36_14070 [Alphaproteobacteria bacterium]
MMAINSISTAVQSIARAAKNAEAMDKAINRAEEQHGAAAAKVVKSASASKQSPKAAAHRVLTSGKDAKTRLKSLAQELRNGNDSYGREVITEIRKEDPNADQSPEQRPIRKRCAR